MNPEYHIAASTIISGIIHALFNSWAITTTSFITGVFIDVDHIIDYAIAHGIRFDIKHFFRFFYEEKYKKITLILHGWEWLAGLTLAAWLTDWNPWVIGALIGWSQHMIFDKILNISTFSSYSLLWRWNKRFESKSIPIHNRRREKKDSRGLK